MTGRRCPRDDTGLQTLTFRSGGVAAEVCPVCRGMFLDKNELLRMTSDRALNRRLRDHVVADRSTSPCPACRGPMDEEEAAGVVVDVCTGCFGIWLDAGELDRLRERPPGPLPAPAGTPVHVARRVAVAGAPLPWLPGALAEIRRRYL